MGGLIWEKIQIPCRMFTACVLEWLHICTCMGVTSSTPANQNGRRPESGRNQGENATTREGRAGHQNIRTEVSITVFSSNPTETTVTWWSFYNLQFTSWGPFWVCPSLPECAHLLLTNAKLTLARSSSIGARGRITHRDGGGTRAQENNKQGKISGPQDRILGRDVWDFRSKGAQALFTFHFFFWSWALTLKNKCEVLGLL